MSEKSKGGGEKQNLIMLLVGLGLLFIVLGGMPGFSGNGYYMMFGGFGIRSLISWVIGLIIKVLWILVWVGVIGGVWQLIKQNWPQNTGLDFDWVAKCLSDSRETCPKCGMQVERDFKFCPNCQEGMSHQKNAGQPSDNAKLDDVKTS